MLKKIISLFLAALFAVSCSVSVFAAGIADKAAFEFKVSEADEQSEQYAGCIQASLYCAGDGASAVTTLGCTLVIDTGVLDTVDYTTGKANTTNYLKDSVQLGNDFALVPSGIKSGRNTVYFDFGATSLAGYNASKKELYIFVCGISISGLKLSEEPVKVADVYLKCKENKSFSASSVRLMKQSEFRNTAECPAPAIYPCEISSKTEAAEICKNTKLTISSSLISSTKTEAETQTDSSVAVSEAGGEKESLQNQITVLNDLISSAQSVSADASTPQGKKLAEAVAKAKAVLGKENVTEAEIESAVQDLQSALKDYNAADEQAAEKKQNKILIIVLLAVLLAAAVASVIVIAVKKKHTSKAE